MKHTDINVVLIARILGYIYEKGNATVSEIVKNIHVSYSTARTYLMFMEDRNLVKITRHGKKKIIEVTEKGIEYLSTMKKIFSIIDVYNLR